ncbi:GNAT family N-acetyltransferase [Vreelandella zhaodongensis]|uniref:GNAT family N-acetyltransferase n=1 Tax=Vreelandella zhaodongensis TaxID=1176240 RepID=A0ABX2SND2_VREZH|nr:GNAT family N-acetyltransferase [Halomonas zhaodongensis]NYS43687.1 GNAT family N-acetyltransferase [Halomonas zhaodongensis]
MNDFNIKLLTPNDWALYKSVRLESLLDSPDSFGSTYEQESALSDADWQSRLDLKARGLDAMPLVAQRGGRAVGLAWGVIHAPDVATAHIYQMWVLPAVRGEGIAKALLHEMTAWALGRKCDQIALAVTTSNAAAVRLYQSSGFIAIDQPTPLRNGSVLMVQPMALNLHSVVESTI